MIRKVTLAVGLAAGYVLGTKAGRQRYEQIVGQARGLIGRPEVQDVKDSLAQTASALGDRAKTSATDALSTVGSAIGHGANHQDLHANDALGI